jgi:hypothetical protein
MKNEPNKATGCGCLAVLALLAIPAVWLLTLPEPPIPAPLTAAEKLREQVALNTNGVIATVYVQDTVADHLADGIIPLVCESVAAQTLDEARAEISESLQRADGTDVETADNVAAGLVATANQPGVCP